MDVRDFFRWKRQIEVQNVISTYLHRRNYPSVCPLEVSGTELLTHSAVESGASRPNSILYSCCNSDPIVIDQNFKYIVGPLFCHLYLDILHGGNSERAAAFFKCHLPSVDKLKCDIVVKDLISSLASDKDTSILQRFRSNKYLVDLYKESYLLLRKFVGENCHVVFLEVLQTYFEIKVVEEVQNETGEEQINSKRKMNDVHVNSSRLSNIIKQLNSESSPIFNINISNTKQLISSGLMKRQSGLMAFAENNHVILKPIHSFDSILNNKEYGDIKLTGHSGHVYTMDLANNNTFLCTGSSDTKLCIYDVTNFNISHICNGHVGPIYCTKISTNGEYVVSGSQDTTARLWSTKTGKPIRVFVGHTQSITSIDFHPNSLYIATGSADKNVRLWSVENGNPLRLFSGAKGTIYSVMFNPKGHCLATSSEDKRIRIWDLVTSKLLVELQCYHEPVLKLLWSTDGKLLCGGSCNGIIYIWDFGKMEENLEESFYDPITTKYINNRLIGLEYAFGTFGALTTTS
ncbi:TAF5-like RNA polymerase II p300/CBP-associated factor-associated factor 65 kDa subunit 5L isoform X2 [Aethina tumida]|uniref:TAF5-like RNA polymerase II p300/CBP-associated factor-associated factor 65 kDa subunit 5L isoform X2 n=1 Tax=Aethina tumida TaxID=116153 RepID=UPI0021483F61|nr:TAF5-like RNA polymerase II p300/CBP-associated factor-associated factor 65 kDa subunit 5L isoform X2 [Aethina tumida]